MTFTSLVGHCVAFIALLFLSWYQPLPKIKRPPSRKVHVRVIERTPPPTTPKKTGRVVTPTPKPQTPRPKKTVVKRTKKPTPKKQTPTPRKRAPTPKRTRKQTPKRTKPPTPRRTPTPTRTPRRTPRRTPAPEITPAPGKSVAIQESPLSDYPFYTMAIVQKIEDNFRLPRHLRVSGVSCYVEFTVMRDGRIGNIQITRSTGDSVLDSYAVRTLESIGRFGPFPDTIREDFVKVRIRFDYDPVK